MLLFLTTWRLRFGDPTVAGWLATVCYLAACVFCVLAATREWTVLPPARNRRIAVFWIVLAAGLAFLGLNKQLDLQTLLIDIGRMVARAQGWYEERRDFQKVFAGLAAIGGAGCLAVLVWLIHGHWRRLALALAGVLLLVCYLGLRIAVFEHVDEALGISLKSALAEALLEVGGAACIGAGAWLSGRRELTSKPS